MTQEERFEKVVDRAYRLLEDAQSAAHWGHVRAVQERSRRGFSDETVQLAVAVAMALEQKAASATGNEQVAPSTSRTVPGWRRLDPETGKELPEVEP